MYNAILVLALISQWIYEPSYDDTRYFQPLTIHERFGIVRLHEYSFEHNCILVHRGTDSVDDVLHDFVASIDSRCSTRGFLQTFERSYLEYSKQMYEEMKKHLYKGTCSGYIATGHSLGGSNAIISSKDLEKWITHVVTFGSPRTCCGDVDELKLTRVVNGDSFNVGMIDPIVSLPVHKNVNNCGGSIFSVTKSNMLLGQKSSNNRSSVLEIEKHLIKNYINSIEERIK